MYSWSLRISLEGGYDVSSVSLLTEGYDSFTINPAIPLARRVYTTNPLGDGRNALLVQSVALDRRLVVGGQQDFLLGTFHGPNATSPPALLFDCEVECGGTVYAPLRSLPYAIDLISLAAIPEPGQLTLVVTLLLVVRTARRRVA